MTEKDLLLTLVESQKDTTKLMETISIRWTYLMLFFAIAFSVFILSVSLMVVGTVNAYFYSDYDYPQVHQTQTQTIEGVDY